MGMGTIVVNVDAIDENVVEFYAPDEYKAFTAKLDSMDISLLAFANYYANEDESYFNGEEDEDELANLVQLMEALEEKFQFEAGLELYVGATGDDGECYDDIDSNTAFWHVGGLEIVTESDGAKKLRANGLVVSNSRYSVYG